MSNITLQDVYQLYSFSCLLKVLDPARFYFKFSVTEDQHFEVKIRGSLKKRLKSVINNVSDFCRQIDIKANNRECYNNQRHSIVNEKGIVFFEPRKGCLAVPAFEKTSMGALFTSPAFVRHDGYHIKKLSDLSIVEEIPDLEKGIVPLILIINRIPEFCTVYSCHGHRFGIPLMPPFVSFLSTSDTMVLRLIELLNRNSDSFFHRWFIDGTVINYCPSYSPYILWKLSIKDIFFYRKRLLRDFQLIQKILQLAQA